MARRTAGAAKALAVAPAVLILGGAAADLLMSHPYSGLPILACAPLIAAIVTSFRATAVYAVLACVALALLDVYHTRDLFAQFTDILTVGLISVIGLWSKWFVDRQGRRLAVASDVAEAAQRAVLPAPPDRVGPLAAAHRYVAAQSGARIGGDFYAVQDTPYGIRAIIGDVRGKGLQAVAAVSVAVGAFREAAFWAPTLPDLAERLDHALDREGDRRNGIQDAEGFTTALLVEIPADGRSATLLNRGHTAPYLLDGGRVRCLEAREPDLPLSIGLPQVTERAAPDVVELPGGASLLLVTDGVTEARNGRGVFYDPCRGLAGRSFTDPEDLADTLVDAVSRWTGGGPQDDMAILVLTSTITGATATAALPARHRPAARPGARGRTGGRAKRGMDNSAGR